MEEKLHNLMLEDRQKLSITSCKEVVSFNENEILLNLADCSLSVKGERLRVEEVSKISGDVIIMGECIDSIVYSKGHRGHREGMLRRIFK